MEFVRKKYKEFSLFHGPAWLLLEFNPRVFSSRDTRMIYYSLRPGGWESQVNLFQNLFVLLYCIYTANNAVQVHWKILSQDIAACWFVFILEEKSPPLINILSPYVFKLHLKGLPISFMESKYFSIHWKKIISQDKGGNIFFPPFIKKHNITMNNERKANEAIPFHGGGAE